MTTKKYYKSQTATILAVAAVLLTVFIILIPACSKNERSGGDTRLLAPPPPPPPPPLPGEADSDVPFEVVDVIPVFPGGNDSLLKSLAEKTRYPENAKINGIQGKVVVRFAVETDCSIGRVSIIKGADPELDAEAIRVVSSLPDFEKPGFKDDKAVAVWMAVPISFMLQ